MPGHASGTDPRETGRRRWSVLEITAAALAAGAVLAGGLWLTLATSVTLYAMPGDRALSRLHHPQWYVLRILRQERPGHADVQHIGGPYTDIAPCLTALPQADKTDPAHRHACGAHAGTAY